VILEKERLSSAIVRDLQPMTDGGLLRCLPKHLSPSNWYKILNQKAFFWFTKDRLLRLLNAGTYRNEAHDVLEVRTQGLLDNYFDKVWFCSMNSGSTKPMAHRGENARRQGISNDLRPLVSSIFINHPRSEDADFDVYEARPPCRWISGIVATCLSGIRLNRYRNALFQRRPLCPC